MPFVSFSCMCVYLTEFSVVGDYHAAHLRWAIGDFCVRERLCTFVWRMSEGYAWLPLTESFRERVSGEVRSVCAAAFLHDLFFFFFLLQCNLLAHSNEACVQN